MENQINQINPINSDRKPVFVIAIIFGIFVIGIVGFAAWQYFEEVSENNNVLEENENKSVKLLEEDKTEKDETKQIEKSETIEKPEIVDGTAYWKTYRNKKYGFEMKYLGDWNYLLNDYENQQLISFYHGKWSGEGESVLTISWGISFQERYETMKKYFEKEYNVTKSTVNVDNVKGKLLTIKSSGYSKSVFFEKNGYIYNFAMISGKENLFDQIISTFKFTEADKTTSLKILSPNGEENWKIGNGYLIRWNSVGSIPQVKIYLVPVDSNRGIRDISYGPIANTGSYTYAIPDCGPGHECSSNFQIPEGEYYIRITDSEGVISDQSDASFSIISN